MNRKTDIYERDEIKAVINFLKTSKSITDITELEGVSIIETNSLVLLAIDEPIYLTSGMYVKIGSRHYQTSNVNLTAKTFDVTATGLTDNIWSLGLKFGFGSKMEMNEILDIEGSSSETDFLRFPLFWMFQQDDGRDHDSEEYDFKTNFKCSFVALSDVGSRSEYRLDNNFKKVLQPLETLFLETIRSPYFSHVFNWEYTFFPYKDYYRYFYGSSDKKKSVFDVPTDAIELGIDLTFKNQY